jgi:23S rRNA (pseudouridine1915-N3)-methyltransferase
MGWDAILRHHGSSDRDAKAYKIAKRLTPFNSQSYTHELAAVVLAEQVYRALTIGAGHPYHSGH